MKRIIIPILIAIIFWFVMFSPWTKEYVNFWLTMTAAGITLTLMSAFLGKDFKKQFSLSLKDVLIGLGSAVVLYVVFFLGDFFSKLLFDFAKDQVGQIYMMKEGENPLLLSLLLILLIGPAEEIFWRGYVQRMLEPKFGSWMALIVTTLIYTLVHIWSFNFMLIMSAMVCGAFWGLLYKYNKNLVTLIVSHAVWDVSVFILFPIV
ncbi:MAG: CPBP family intramembrane metalloprotease [Paludibacteraceae bacterium]|nr:CPBP family intramembrane metalloprotease [Paludibacteraceae bacterium]MBP8967460.1 CPBP family intramembrane metalloprotease [Paludibacteraceae bacterium]HOJ65573.1 type II CAAX endopeptidase family protein [Paludibacteraceae bacterium]HOL28943.1 type II CAAX endopeptidase family protein [Paludibacteraceae bacterium]HON01535.1 type II CAAX endopeptidase family protein [Paludibacteraceae bacterium]